MALRIENAIDLHCHFGPDTIGRVHNQPHGFRVTDTGDDHPHHSVTAVEAVREAFDSGHRALVLKSHSFCSAQLADNLSTVVPGIKVFGGACTDYASGGLNIAAVESALLLGARIIWLPTVNSCEDHAHAPDRFPMPGIAVIGADGRPLPLVRDIFALVREYDAVLATGHTSSAEHYAVVREFAPFGKVLVTHAGEALAGPNLSPGQAAELADMGAIIELTAECCVHVFNRAAKSPEAMAEAIQRIGHERCTLSSDYGWSTLVPRPAEGFRDFLEKLWNVGVSEDQLTRMAADNPARLLSI